MKSRVAALLSAYAFIVLLVGVTLYGKVEQNNVKNKSIESFQTYLNAKGLPPTEYVSGMPVEIVIPRVHVQALVKPGNYYVAIKSWEISPTNAHFATLSTLPNTISGNTLIYAHNSENLFGATRNLKPGDTAYVKTSNNHIFEYVYVSYEDVTPDNVEIFRYHGVPRLTVMTCDGFSNEKRRQMYFTFVKVV